MKVVEVMSKLGLPRTLCARLGLAACLSLPLLSVPREAAGAPEELARAREAFDKGLALEAAKSWDAALVEFRQVARVRATSAVRFHIARCLEQLGQWTEAIGAYELAINDAQGPDRGEILKLATEAATRLRESLPSLELEVGAGAEALRVRLDGVELRVNANLPRQLDPGRHELEVIDGERHELHVLTLAPAEHKRFLLSPLTTPPAALPLKPKSKVTPAAGSRARHGIAPVIVLSAGAASLAGAAIFWGLARSKEKELRGACYTPAVCPPSAEAIHDQGERYTLATNVAGGLGFAAVAAGLVWLSWPVRSEQGAHAGVAPWVGVGPGRITLSGQF